MADVVYAIELDTLDTTGMTMVKVKIGKTTDLESRLANFQTGMLGEPEVLGLWFPNPDVSLTSVENGVLDIAEQYAYNRSGETFVFLQDGYQRFSETVDKLLEATTRAEIEGESTVEEEPVDIDRDFTGEVPAVIRLNGETHEVSSWTECLVTVAEIVLSRAESQEPIKQITGRTRDYVVEEGRQSQQVKPKPIGDTGLYIETNFSANDVVRVSKRILDAYDYDLAEFDVFVEE